MPRKKVDKSNPSDNFCHFCDKPHDNKPESTCPHCGTALPCKRQWRAYHGPKPIDKNDAYVLPHRVEEEPQNG